MSRSVAGFDLADIHEEVAEAMHDGAAGTAIPPDTTPSGPRHGFER